MQSLASPILEVVKGAPKEGPSIAGWHKIVDFLRCPQEYKFRHILGIEPKNKEDKVALTIGTLCHIGRAHWFGTQFKASIDECQAAITQHVQESGGKYKVESEREALRLIAAYVEEWRSKPLPLCRAVEYDIGPAPMAENDPLYAYRTARVDDVSNYPDALNKLCIGDLKTTSDSISGCINEYRQNGQFILYNMLWRMAKEGQAVFGPIDGIVVDVMTKEKVPKFYRERIEVTAFQEHWFRASMLGYLSAASQVSIKTPVPRNVTMCARAISRGSFMCDYQKLCHYGGAHINQYVNRSNGELPSKELVEI